MPPRLQAGVGAMPPQPYALPTFAALPTKHLRPTDSYLEHELGLPYGPASETLHLRAQGDCVPMLRAQEEMSRRAQGEVAELHARLEVSTVL